MIRVSCWIAACRAGILAVILSSCRSAAAAALPLRRSSGSWTKLSSRS